MIGFIIGMIVGATLMVATYFGILKYQESKFPPPNLRRGLLINAFTVSDRIIGEENIDVQFELLELERTKDRSKVKILNSTCTNSVFQRFQEKINKSVDNSWLDSSKIGWIEIEKDPREVRHNKIKNILK